LPTVPGNDEECIQLALEASGTCVKGISAAQASSATANIHHTPIDFISNKLHINMLAFRKESPLTILLQTRSCHTVSYHESYELLISADTSF
jgi:hypothetical protein